MPKLDLYKTYVLQRMFSFKDVRQVCKGAFCKGLSFVFKNLIKCDSDISAGYSKTAGIPHAIRIFCISSSHKSVFPHDLIQL